jgi:hypothetical protein
MDDNVRRQEMLNRPLFPYLKPSDVYHCPEDQGEDFRPDGPFFGPTRFYAYGCSYRFNSNPFPKTKRPVEGILPGQIPAWVDSPSLYIMAYESPARPVLKYSGEPCIGKKDDFPYYYFHWHFNNGKTFQNDITKDRQKAISPILFVDGHSAKHDFSRALRDDPVYPTEPTRDWIWYQPLGNTNPIQKPK